MSVSFLIVALPLIAAAMVLGQVDPAPGQQLTPEQIPPWFYLALVPAAGWLAKEFWPWFSGLISSEVRERRAEQAQKIQAQDDRLITALETSANAMVKSAEASMQIAVAMQTMAQVRVADNIALQRIERRLDDMTRGSPAPLPVTVKDPTPEEKR